MMTQREKDFEYKVDNLRQMMLERGYGCIELKSQANFSWLTRGRGFIGLASTVACGSLFITLDGIHLVAENIEATRLHQEQMDGNKSIQVLEYPWDAPSQRDQLVHKITQGLKTATDSDLESEFFKLRTVMSVNDLEDFKKLCHQAAEILESICKNIKSGISEFELAGTIASRFWEANIEPITTLIAFDERALLYRHPLMTDNTLKNYALVSICGRRNGLIVSISRDVLIDLDQEMMDKHTKCAMVNAAFYHSLKVGSTLHDVFLKCIKQYEKQGYPLEYKEHHQGGLTGFIPREVKANLGCNHEIKENEIYAFNPTLQGAKCEDTVHVSAQGVEVMTHTGDYEYVSCQIEGEAFLIPTVYIINK